MMSTLRRLGALVPFVFVLALMMAIMNSCGGGGGMPPVPSDNNEARTLLEVGRTYSNGTLIVTKIYRAIDDTTPLQDGSEFKFEPGHAVNFVARAWAILLQPDGSYKEEEITEVPGVSFSWAFRGLDENNAALEETLEKTLKQVTIAWDDIPGGGCYDLSVRAEISPQDLLTYVNSRIPQPPAVQPGGGGGGDDDQWIAGGFIGGLAAFLAFATCPSDAAGIEACREGGLPSTDTDFDVSGPAEADPGQQVTIHVTSNCPDGWTVTWPGGSKSGKGNGTVTTIMGNVDLPFMGDDNCGEDDDHTVRVRQQAGNQPPTVTLSANPNTGNAPLSSTLTATASDPDGTIVNYQWDFDNNSSYEQTTTTNTVQHTFTVVGNHIIRVRVVDNDGATATATTTVTVTQGQDDNPFEGVQHFEIRPNSSSASTLDATIGEITDLNVLASKDGQVEFLLPSGTVYNWSLAGDDFHPALDEQGKNCRVYSTLAEDGILKAEAKKGDHLLVDTLHVSVVRVVSFLPNAKTRHTSYDEATDTLFLYK